MPDETARPGALDEGELRFWVDEALKRNDAVYAALVQIDKLLPEAEGDLRRIRQEAEDHQQAVRKGLVPVRRRLHTRLEESGR
jgi:hypothetical protein